MPAKSKAQQRFMAMVSAYQRGELDSAPEAVKKAAGSMSNKSARDFAKTKRKGLPTKVNETYSLHNTVEELMAALTDKRQERRELAQMSNDATTEPLARLDDEINDLQVLIAKKRRRVSNNAMSFREFVELGSAENVNEGVADFVRGAGQALRQQPTGIKNAVAAGSLEDRKAKASRIANQMAITFEQMRALCVEHDIDPAVILNTFKQMKDGYALKLYIYYARRHNTNKANSKVTETFGAFIKGAGGEISNKVGQYITQKVDNSAVGKLRSTATDIWSAGQQASDAENERRKQPAESRQLQALMKKFSNLAALYAKLAAPRPQPTQQGTQP